MDWIEATRIQAMLDVMDGDFLYHFRRICRWYASKYSTPLHQVEELPTEYVLQHFFEAQYEEMTPAQRTKLAVEMTETEEEVKAKKKKEKAGSDETFIRKAKKEAKKAEKARLANLAKEAAKTAKLLSDMAKTEMFGPTPKEEPAPPDVSMSFDDNGNLLGDEESIPVSPT